MMVTRFKNEYVTVADAADLLGVAQSTIRRWIKEERVPTYRLEDRRILLKRDQLSGLYSSLHTTDELDDLRNVPLMTAEERRHAMNVVRELERSRDELVRKRGGKPFLPAEGVIREMRDERTRELP